MISTFQALAVAVVALLPGASYTFAYERLVGSFGISFSDRLVRFLAASAIFHGVFSGVELALYREMKDGGLDRLHPALFEVIVLAYVLLPTVAGSLVGYGQIKKWTWVRWIVGSTPEPRAWDFLWRQGIEGVVRIKLKSGNWLAGLFGTVASDGPGGRPMRSYASGYPEEGDLYLALQLKVDPHTGAFMRDDGGLPQPVAGRSGLLIRWSEVDYIDIQEF